MTESTAVTVFKPDELALITSTVAKDATKEELAMFLYVAAKRGLNPLARQIHFVKRGNSGTIQTGIDGFRLIAQRTGQYAPSGKPTQFEVSKTGNLISATVYGNKIMNGTAFEFSATAYYDEYCPKMPNGQVFPMWQKMPRTMLEKCAESKLLRKGFPEELSGLYSDEEMHQADAQPLNYVQAGGGAGTTVTDVIEGQAETVVICPKHGVEMRKNKWGGYSHATDEKGKEGKMIWCNIKAQDLIAPPAPTDDSPVDAETPELAPETQIDTVVDDGATFETTMESLSKQIWADKWQPQLRQLMKAKYGYSSRKDIKENKRNEIIDLLTQMAEIK
jgi:phage recombination protein Bet